MTTPSLSSNRRGIQLAVLVAALGYFVDVYDLLLFSIVRVKSLQALGVTGPDLLSVGVHLINVQMTGLLIGGIFWGVFADKFGRRSVLFGSILLYSLANIANGLVQSVEQYALLRFIAGLGLAGELGAGITLVTELMSREGRGYGTTLVASLGLLGAVVAGLVGDLFPWRTAYFIGGGLGLLLLSLRIGVRESGMFEAAKRQTDRRGNIFALLSSPRRALKYLAVVLVGLPTWYVMGILVTFSPEIGKALGILEPINPGRSVMMAYIGATIGDLASGLISQYLKSRKRTIGLWLLLATLGITTYFLIAGRSPTALYLACMGLGATSGYWAVFVTVASEQFGTNVRGTVASTAPNFVRGAVVPITTMFQLLKPSLGIPGSAIAVGALTIAVAVISLMGLDETYGKDLDYIEP